jgi:hypothetical protein
MAKPWECEGLECKHGAPSSSHACGAGPFFSQWERDILIDRARFHPMFAAPSPGSARAMIRAGWSLLVVISRHD